MSRWTALLLFPFVPSVAARALQGAWIPAALPLVAAGAAAMYLSVHGAEAADASWTALTLLRVLVGMSLGGGGAAWIGARVAGREARWTELAGPVLAAAGWAPFVFIAFLKGAELGGANTAVGVYAGVGLLIWGIAAGLGITAGDEELEPGRLLVASCLGIGGVIIGLWCSYALPPQPWVHAIRAPVSAAPIRGGEFLLVRTADSGEPGLVLLREPDSREAVLVRRAANGSLTPVGEIQLDPQMLQDWNTAGRVFFQFGDSGGASVGPGEQRVKPSQD